MAREQPASYVAGAPTASVPPGRAPAASATAAPPLARLRAVVDALAAEDLSPAADADMMAEVAALRREVDRLEAQWLRRLGEADRREAWRSDGSLTAAASLRSRCRMAPGAATDRVLVARRLQQLPATAAAFTSGDLSYSHARLIARAATPERAAEAQRDEHILAEAGARMCPKLLGNVVRHWVDAVDPDGSLADAERAWGSQHFRFTPLDDGRSAVRGEFDAEGTETLRQALDAFMGTALRGDRGDSSDARTTSERAADALIDMARAVLDAGLAPVNGGHRPHVSATVDLETLERRAGRRASREHAARAAAAMAGASLEWGGPITAETARRLACDASISRVITDAAGIPLDVGRATRTVTPAQRRALAARDGGCRFPGCDRPPPWTDGHHIIHWADGGPTNLSNLILLCRRHHRAVHEGGWRITAAPDGGFEFTRGP